MAATVVINGTVYAGAAQVSLTGQSGGKSTYLYVTGDPSLISPSGADITINGSDYNGVSVVELPIQGGGHGMFWPPAEVTQPWKWRQGRPSIRGTTSRCRSLCIQARRCIPGQRCIPARGMGTPSILGLRGRQAASPWRTASGERPFQCI